MIKLVKNKDFLLINSPVFHICLYLAIKTSNDQAIISSAFALWANAELYILGLSLTSFLPYFLSPFLPSFLRQKVENICQY